MLRDESRLMSRRIVLHPCPIASFDLSTGIDDPGIRLEYLINVSLRSENFLVDDEIVPLGP